MVTGTQFHIKYFRALSVLFNCERDVDNWSFVCLVGLLFSTKQRFENWSYFSLQVKWG